MSNDLNQCNFIGRLARDTEVRYSASGDAIASLTLAVGSTWKDKAGAKQESTEWVNVTAFGKLGEICAQYLKKGSQVFISGRMKTDKYTDKQGVDKYSTKIVAERMQMLGGKSEGQQSQQPQDKPSANFDDMSDDIPFN